MVLDSLETGRVPVTAQLTAVAVQCEYEQLYVRHSLPAAFAANMFVSIAHGAALRRRHDSVDAAAQLALAVKLFGQLD